jgi:hypothetical protein
VRLIEPAGRADIGRVQRSLGLPLLLVSLVVGGILFATQLQSSGPTAPAVTQAETQAIAAVADANFGAANAALQAWYADHATYAGASLDASYGVTVVRADSGSYCLQTAAGQAIEHEVGPGGPALPGAC